MHKLIFASLMALSAFGASTASAESILIGQSASLSGPAAAAGQAFVLGAHLYLDAVNLAGGINGRKVELRTLDDAYDAAVILAAARQSLSDGRRVDIRYPASA
jgi:ABC-type branched-subunit amino acid transport system substrate-binding protein